MYVAFLLDKCCMVVLAVCTVVSSTDKPIQVWKGMDVLGKEFNEFGVHEWYSSFRNVGFLSNKSWSTGMPSCHLLKLMYQVVAIIMEMSSEHEDVLELRSGKQKQTAPPQRETRHYKENTFF